MQERNGARRQSGMALNKGIEQAILSANTPVRAIVAKDGVRHFDTGTHRRTLVHLKLFGYKGDLTNACLYNVPLIYQKMNRENGEEWTPEEGDIVAVGFFGGNLRDPFVMGYLGPFDGEVFTPAAKRTRSYRKRSGTSEEIDKDGNRTTIVQGSETVTVNTGDVTITVAAGKCTVSVKGKTQWTSEGTIEHIGAAGATPKGNVQGDCICAYTGGVHPMVSATVKSSP